MTFNFKEFLDKKSTWSERTFGPGLRTKGIIDHITKELKEIEEQPLDLSEWIDIVNLALDGSWRAGYSSEQIINELITKHIRNEHRTWPDWRTSDPDKAIEHVKINK